MPFYDRVRIPCHPSSCDYPLGLYGFVETDAEGKPLHTYVCSMTPSVYVQSVAWEVDCDDDAIREEIECSEIEHGTYYSVSAVRAGLDGHVFEADDDDDAREECSANH